jgi:DNA-binding NarL/FixJ family response regulator
MNANPGNQTALRPSAKPAKAGIVVVDDHPIVREGLVRVFEETDDLRVCGQAEDIPQAIQVIARSNPALVLADLSLAGQNGLELIKALSVTRPRLPILVHSMHEEALYAERCLRAGARGYVMKAEPPPRLISAVRQVLRGEIALSEAMTERLLSRLSEGKTSRGTSPVELLSNRELQVFELLGRGYRSSEIAQKLQLSGKTIQAYREHIKHKLQVRDAVSLVRLALQWVESQSLSEKPPPA